MTTLALAGLALALAGAPGPREAVDAMVKAYLKQGADVGHLEGARALAPFMTRRFGRVLDEAAACQTDWVKQQPKGSTDKPPFVDCCLFASSPEGLPAAFSVGAAEVLPDGRQRVSVEYTWVNPPRVGGPPPESSRWTDAFLVAQEDGAWLVDDFVFMRDVPDAPPLVLSQSFEGCQGPRWTGGR
jgi:hypothetical protein